MTDIYDPANFVKVCVNTVLEVLRESTPVQGPRAYHLCHKKTRELTTSFRYHLLVIFFENREELLPHLKSMTASLVDDPNEYRHVWSLMQTFLHSLLTPITVSRLIDDSRATTDWLAEEMDILNRMIFLD